MEKANLSKISLAECPKKINFGIHERSCNLSCPKCLVHSEDYLRGIELKKNLGHMNITDIIKVFDEVRDYRPIVSPSFWSEPLLNKKLFINFCKEAKKRGIPVSINTNALLIDRSMAEFLIENLEVISISIDAITKETLLKTRSTSELEQIVNAVNMLIIIRGNKINPRIVTSFTEEVCNRHEKKEFIDYWITKVDAVRVNQAYSDQRTVDSLNDHKRLPCREIYDSMTIDFEGTVRMCCLDGYRETALGNVFKNGVLNIWRGDAYSKLRQGHEEGDEKLHPFCKTCEQWAGFNVLNEHEEDGVLIRKTVFSTYYNRMDRLDSWSKALRRNDSITREEAL